MSDDPAPSGGGTPDYQVAFGVLLAQSLDGIVLADRQTHRLVAVNDAFCALTGFDRAELVGRTVVEVGMVTQLPGGQAALERVDPTVRGLFRHPLRRKDGADRSVEYSHTLLPGSPLVMSVVRDVTDAEHQAAELALQAAIGGAVMEGLALIDPDDRIILRTNATMDELFGYGPGELQGRPVTVISPQAQRLSEVVPEELPPGLRSKGVVWRGEVRGRRKDGSPIWCWVHVVVVEHPDLGTVWAAFHGDITARKQVEETRSRLAAIVSSSGDAVVGVLPDGRIDSWNYGAQALYGYRPEEVIGQQVTLLVGGELDDARQRIIDSALGGAVERFETEDVRRDGSCVAVAVTLSPIRDQDGTVTGVARVVRDVTERKHFEHQLQFLADHDPLTRLFNRRRFAEELARQQLLTTRYGQPAALLVADLDHFKYVNDTLGHLAGDELIRGIGRVLGRRLRATDTLARLGGDEFAAILPGTDEARACELAEDLGQAVRDLKTVLGRRTVRCTVSIGVARIGAGAGHDVLAAADQAMYAAKRQGRDRVVLAGGEDDDFHLHVEWSRRLHDALEHRRFELYAQPIIEVATGDVRQYELLLRLHGDRGAVLAPAEFIDTAERLGIIREIDRWVTGQALRLLATDHRSDRRYAVNVSGMSIADEGLVESAEQALRRGVDPDRLTFEITETAAIADFDQARAFVDRLAGLGFTTALDDFGAGFGAFSYLKHLPVDYVKIDGEFVAALPGTTGDQTLVKAIVDVAHGLGKQTVAEHVGSARALDLLRGYGVDYGQGFHFGRPVPASSLAPT